MSFVLPGRSPSYAGGNRSTSTYSRPAAEAKAEEEADDHQHRNLCAELRSVAERQAARIEKLKLNTAVELEHASNLKRVELEQRRSLAENQIENLAPRLDQVRVQWEQTRASNQGYEMEWGNLRTQYQQTKLRVDALRDQLQEGRTTADETRKRLAQMREHLHALERDKATLRSKMQWGLECALKDEKFLATRVSEEEAYRQRVERAMQEMEAQYQDSHQQHAHEIAPLDEDVGLLGRYLEEMQERTRTLREKCLDMETKAATVEDHWLEAVRSVYEVLERANHQDQLNDIVLRALEAEIMKCDDRLVRQKAGNLDPYWLSNAVLVWEMVVDVVQSERQKMHVRDDSAQQLSELSQRCHKTKEMLQRIKHRVEGEGTERRMLLQDITELHFLLQEKRDTESHLLRFLQEVATQLEEDLSRVMHLVRKDTYDDYISSTDHDDDVSDFDAQKLRIEGDEDIARLVSSVDLDPNDPTADETLRHMAHRPEGPLREFAVSRRRALEAARAASTAGDGAAPQRGALDRTRKANVILTLERAFMDAQAKVTDEVVAYVRNREKRAEQGLLDKSQERVQPDARYITRAKETQSRIDRWVQAQKEDPNRGVSLLNRATASTPGGAGPRSPTPAGGARGAVGVSATPKIVIESARVPPEIARANHIAKANYFVTYAVRGDKFMVYLRRTNAPQLRHVFLSRDFTRIISRRVTHNEAEYDETSIPVAEVVDVVLGHHSDVFRSAKASARHALKEAEAMSLVSSITTLDLECTSREYRDQWATIFTWVVNELRPGGVVATLLKTGKISVVDTLSRGKDEVRDRSVLQVNIANT